MNLSIVVYILGWILICVSALMGLPLITSLIYMESVSAKAFLLTMAICLGIGIILIGKKPKNKVFYLREGFVVTALSWIVISVVGSLPFIISGAIPDPISALFETVSGFTTTGASILEDVEALPKGMLFWRSFTHWIGGMGVLVFLLTLLPLTGGSHVNLMKAESPGPQVEKLVPKVQSTAKILYGIYIFMTLLQIFLLLLGRMPLFDALTISFGTAGTGGFGIKNDSMAGYSPYIQNVITVFMILFGINFNFYFLLLLRKFRRAAAMEEVHWYLIIIACAITVIGFNVRDMYDSLGEAFRQAAFQVGSIITTTGYSTTDFDLWPAASKTILVMLMFVGACAGSTGGGIKVSRFAILLKTVRKEIKRLMHPQSIGKVSMDGKVIPHETVRSTNVYMATYVIIFAFSILLVSFNEYDLTTNFTAVAATFNNIGPGLSKVGPVQNFSIYSNGAKLVFIFDMLAGRLEIFPFLITFTRDAWRKF